MQKAASFGTLAPQASGADAASLFATSSLQSAISFFQIGDIFADAGKILVECFAVQIAVVDDLSDILVILLNLILKRMLTGADLLNFYEFICFLSTVSTVFFSVLLKFPKKSAIVKTLSFLSLISRKRQFHVCSAVFSSYLISALTLELPDRAGESSARRSFQYSLL